MTFVIGLTGSIGMGKSTTATMFREAGIPVWDADAVVHKLYGPNGAATSAIANTFPTVIIDQTVSRPLLRELIAADSTILDRVQAIVHPLVAADRAHFLTQAEGNIVLLDIPLLFETGADEICDLTVVVSVPSDVQKERVLSRGEMTESDFEMIKSRQMPDAEKRSRADRVIATLTLDQTRADVQNLLEDIRRKLADA